MYEFTEDCMIHIEQIDNEHRKLFQMLNEAFTMVQETEDVSAITISLLSNLKNYAMTHFAHEEAYMESTETYTKLFEDAGRYRAIMNALAQTMFEELQQVNRQCSKN